MDRGLGGLLGLLLVPAGHPQVLRRVPVVGLQLQHLLPLEDGLLGHAQVVELDRFPDHQVHVGTGGRMVRRGRGRHGLGLGRGRGDGARQAQLPPGIVGVGLGQLVGRVGGQHLLPLLQGFRHPAPVEEGTALLQEPFVVPGAALAVQGQLDLVEPGPRRLVAGFPLEDGLPDLPGLHHVPRLEQGGGAVQVGLVGIAGHGHRSVRGHWSRGCGSAA